MGGKIEYLIIFDNINNFCNGKASFTHLLQSIDKIKINKENIIYEKLTLKFELQTEESEDKSIRYFHLTVYFDEVDIDIFEELLKDIRMIIHKTTKRLPIILWDDISYYYSNKMYPIIYRIENLMRKLITKFMTVKLGLAWSKKAVPNEIKDLIKAESIDLLYQADFIHLSSFLFNNYSTKNIQLFFDKIKKLDNIEKIDYEELKDYLPRSNWERYFKPIVDCDRDYLFKRWASIYKIRCKVAHNIFIKREDFEELEKLEIEIEPYLIKAIQNLDKVEISIEERKEVTHSFENISEIASASLLNVLQEQLEMENAIKLHELGMNAGAISTLTEAAKALKLQTEIDAGTLGALTEAANVFKMYQTEIDAGTLSALTEAASVFKMYQTEIDAGSLSALSEAASALMINQTEISKLEKLGVIAKPFETFRQGELSELEIDGTQKR